MRDSREAETIAVLTQLPFADQFVLIRKNSLSPAAGTRFDQWIDEHPQLQTMIVVGDCTDLCVYQVAMHLRLRANALNLDGFRVIVPAGAVETYDIPESEAKGSSPAAHPGDWFHRLFLYHLALNGAEVPREITHHPFS